jgi:hypothetical protein
MHEVYLFDYNYGVNFADLKISIYGSELTDALW